MKKNLPAIIAAIGGLFIIAFLAWAFSQHGTIGLYRVNGFFAGIFIIFGVLALVLLGVAGLMVWRTSRGKHVTLWLAVPAVILSVPAVVIPVLAFTVLGGVLAPGIGDSQPRVLMADSAGANGIPDMAVVVTTGESVPATLVWGTGDDMTTVHEQDAARQHVFMLRDLSPDTVYTYRVDDGPEYSFTSPPVTGSLRLAVASDAHYGIETARNDLTAAMLEDIADPVNDFDAFFFIGDLVEYGFLTDQWSEAFEAFSIVTSKLPVRYAAGNHDTLFSGFGRYLDYCYPEGTDIADGSRLWYRLDFGDVHVLVLDLEWSAETFSDEQAAWLQAQLADIPDDEWKIVMGHGFYYGSGLEIAGWDWYDNPETIDALTPLFREYGVDMVFAGHLHRPELLRESGIVYVNCGAFGGLPDPEPSYVSPYSLWDGTGEYAFADITFEDDEGTLVFRDPGFEALRTYTFSRE